MLYPYLDFMAKSQALDAVAEPVKVKAFTLGGGEDPDRRLCPVRALLQYRKVTASPEIRKGRSKLFILYKPLFVDEIKKATISAWLTKARATRTTDSSAILTFFRDYTVADCNCRSTVADRRLAESPTSAATRTTGFLCCG